MIAGERWRVVKLSHDVSDSNIKLLVLNYSSFQIGCLVNVSINCLAKFVKYQIEFTFME